MEIHVEEMKINGTGGMLVYNLSHSCEVDFAATYWEVWLRASGQHYI